MLNIPYLLKCLDTDSLDKLADMVELSPLDFNLEIWQAEANKEIEVKKGKVKLLSVPDYACDWSLANKMLQVVEYYNSKKEDITLARLLNYTKDPQTGVGYPAHESIQAAHALIDSKKLATYTLTVPEIKKKRPYQEFKFLTLPENADKQWGEKAVENYKQEWAKK